VVRRGAGPFATISMAVDSAVATMMAARPLRAEVSGRMEVARKDIISMPAAGVVRALRLRLRHRLHLHHLRLRVHQAAVRCIMMAVANTTSATAATT